jgi:3',5'-cyclic AMP phosphodiesterase CpdA
MPETPDGFPVEVPSHRLAHLSDTHLTSRDVLYNGRIDADAAVHRAAAVLRRAAVDGRPVDALVVTGDLTDTGDPDAYGRVAAALEGLAPQIIWVTGNHDVRTAFHATLLGVDDSGPLVRVHGVGGLRVIALDSTVPGAGHGVLTAAHLADLAEVLATPALHGTVVALHHAPVPPPSPLLAYFALERSSRSALADIIAGTDVRLVLAGHHHLAQSSSLAGIPVAVAGSTAIRTDPLAPPGHERTYASGSFQLIDLHPTGGVVVSVIPVDGADQVFDLDQEGCAEVIAAHPVARPSTR